MTEFLNDTGLTEIIETFSRGVLVAMAAIMDFLSQIDVTAIMEFLSRLNLAAATEILDHLQALFVEAMARLTDGMEMLFEYLISVGVRQDALILAMTAVGLCILVLVLILLMLIRGLSSKPKKAKKSREQKATPPTIAATEEDSEPVLITPPPESESESQSQEANEAEELGFAIFKKGKKTKSKKQSTQPVGASPSDSPKGSVEDELLKIEQEMRALKELYDNEMITREVYFQETKPLYDKAKALAE